MNKNKPPKKSQKNPKVRVWTVRNLSTNFESNVVCYNNGKKEGRVGFVTKFFARRRAKRIGKTLGVKPELNFVDDVIP